MEYLDVEHNVHETAIHKAGRWVFQGTPVSPTNKTDGHNILTEILLKVALNTINQTKPKQGTKH